MMADSIYAEELSLMRLLVSGIRATGICLTGDWGTGKTYLWGQLVDHADAQEVDSFVYVSLFGVESLQGLKEAIFLALPDVINQALVVTQGLGCRSSRGVSSSNSFGPTRWVDTPREIRRLISRLRPLYWRLPYLLRNDYSSIIHGLGFGLVKNLTICFDDIERRSDNLKLKEALGLASYLKESRNCNIVFIFSESRLPHEDRSELSTYFEKVFDYKIQLQPKPADCYSVVLQSGCRSLDDDSIRHVLQNKLGIVNIRNLQAIESAISLYQKQLESVLSDSLIERYSGDIACSVALLKAVQLGAIPDSPSLEDLASMGWWSSMQGSLNLSKGNELYQFCLKYGYNSESSINKFVCESLVCGIPRATQLLKAIEQEEIARHNRDADDAINTVLQSFKCFTGDEDKFTGSLESTYGEHARVLPVNKFNTALTILRELERIDLVEILVLEYIRQHENNLISNDKVAFEKIDEFFGEQIRLHNERAAQEMLRATSLGDILGGLDKWPEFSNIQLECACQASHDAYVNEIRGLSGERFEACASGYNILARSSLGPGRAREIYNKMTDALDEIAESSLLNKIRARRMFSFRD